MKKFYFSLVTFLFLAVASAQIVNIPDANFKAKLLAASPSNNIASSETPSSNGYVSSYNVIDTNGDGEIQVSEATLIKYLDVSSSNIANFEGINNFNFLESLFCSDNHISNVNVTALANLRVFYCLFSQISSLNVEGLNNLRFLYCEHNQLTTLNVNNLTNLFQLNCDYNQLTTIDLDGLINLYSFNCGYNQLTNIDFGDLISLRFLYCGNNLLSDLELTGLTDLFFLSCYNNQITSLNLSMFAGLSGLSCQINQLTTLLIKNNNASWSLLNFQNNPNLTYICADEEDVSLVQTKITEYGYTNCTVDSNCNLSVETNLFDDNFFTIYPNPVDEILNLTAKQATEIYSLTIYNLLGQQVQTTTNPTNTIDVSSLKTGNYIIKVVTDKGVSSSKFVKE